jgi:hypothetical protein
VVPSSQLQQLLEEKKSASAPQPAPQQLEASISTTNPLKAPANTTPPTKSKAIISLPMTFGAEKKFLIISKILLCVKET